MVDNSFRTFSTLVKLKFYANRELLTDQNTIPQARINMVISSSASYYLKRTINTKGLQSRLKALAV